MGFSLLPEYLFPGITDISPTFLKNNGIKFLMLDLDNTLAAYDEHSPSEDILSWISSIKDNGITPAIISNTSRVMRVCSFAESFDVSSVARAHKPSPVNVLYLMETFGFKESESALIGDQVFTDVLAANRAGIISIVIKPRKFTNVFLALRYIIEQPIRYFSKAKIMDGNKANE